MLIRSNATEFQTGSEYYRCRDPVTAADLARREAAEAVVWLCERRFAHASWSGGTVRAALASALCGAAGSHVAPSEISCTPSAR